MQTKGDVLLGAVNSQGSLKAAEIPSGCRFEWRLLFRALSMLVVIGVLIPSQTRAALFIWADVDTSVTVGSSVDVPIAVTGFQDIAGMQFTLAWDPAVLQLTGAGTPPTSVTSESLTLPTPTLTGLNLALFNYAAPGKLTFVWEPGTGGNVNYSGSALFTLHFDAIGSSGGNPSLIEFVNSPTARQVSTINGGIPSDITGSVTFGSGDVTVSPVPEPQHAALAVSACLLFGAVAFRWVSKRKSPPELVG